ncbi:hypothetical protein [Streptomyces sp. NPDC057545]|uniref:hypothetical protein n=1 Tax=Streptomyces sp. NPDC057545 TaxID=3346164 RepID=UPI0036B9E18A
MAEYATAVIAQVIREYRATVLPHFEARNPGRGRQAVESLVKRWGPGPVRATAGYLAIDLALDER